MSAGPAFNLTSEFLDRNVTEGRAQRPALYCADHAYTYADVAALCSRAGNVLLELGVERGDRVLLALGDGVEFVAIWYAVPKIGAVVAEAYTFLQPKDYEYYLNYTQAAVVVVDALTLEKIRAIRGHCPGLRSTLVVGADGPLAPGEVSFDALLGRVASLCTPAHTTRDDVAIWKFTTGSTGSPKAAVHRHYNPAAAFVQYAQGVLQLRADDVVLPVPKLFFGYARDLTTLFTFGVGASGVIFPERSTPERIFQLIARYRPTILVNVPTMIHEMNRLGHPGRYDVSSLRLCISSGEALPLDVHQTWAEHFGIEVLEGIGSSEMYHIYISNRSGSVRPGSAGRLVPGYSARIVDQDGVPVPDGEPGELWVSGESAASGYWNEPARSARTFAPPWVRTGDVFARDAEGYFWYRGRTDDLLKIGGIWVAPLEVEACLRGHPAVRECAVVGVSQEGLTTLRAYVVLRDAEAGSAALVQTLQEFVRTSLAPHKYPRVVTFVEELPRTPTGKVDRRALAASLLAQS